MFNWLKGACVVQPSETFRGQTLARTSANGPQNLCYRRGGELHSRKSRTRRQGHHIVAGKSRPIVEKILEKSAGNFTPVSGATDGSFAVRRYDVQSGIDHCYVLLRRLSGHRNGGVLHRSCKYSLYASAAATSCLSPTADQSRSCLPLVAKGSQKNPVRFHVRMYRVFPWTPDMRLLPHIGSSLLQAFSLVWGGRSASFRTCVHRHECFFPEREREREKVQTL